MSLRERVFNTAYYVALMALAMAIVNWLDGEGFLLEGKDLFGLAFFAIGLFEWISVGSKWRAEQ